MNYDIRQSQVIHTWPTGAIIDFPQLSLIMLCHDDDINDWGTSSSGDDDNARTIINDSRLAEAFRVDSFIVPPASNGINNSCAYGIRFPRAHYCPKCGLIVIAKQSDGKMKAPNAKSLNVEMKPLRCLKCFDNQKIKGPSLVPMRFVIATEEGFLDDFPWDWFVHKNKPEERNRGNQLYYRSKGGSASLKDIVIESKNGNTLIAKMDLGRIFEQEIFVENCPVHGHYLKYMKGYLSKPWKGWDEGGNYYRKELITIPKDDAIWDKGELSDTAKARFPRTMQRGAGNIIFPIVYSSILLPESTYEQICPPEVQKNIQNTIVNITENMPFEYEDFGNEEWKKYFLAAVNRNENHSLLKLGYSIQQVHHFIINHFGEETQERFGNRAQLLRSQEFKAFCGNETCDDKIWFKKRRIDGNEYNKNLSFELLDEVVLLEKLSALKVYRGFTRVKPLMSEELAFAESNDKLADYQLSEFHRIQDARKDPINTKQLPAVEVRGEGIFLKFNNVLLNDWANNYPDSRLNVINNNLRQANRDFNQNNEPVTKRYLFLHTLSHILLKELAEDCGYSLSSLAEIIYCSAENKIFTTDEMNGILIYTTTPDSEGSLGGLVEKGDSKYLSSILIKGIDRAKWCSSDPLCISAEHGQGFMGLNLAACYSCILLPETSCEKMNKYLDRATIVGTLSGEKMGLFQS